MKWTAASKPSTRAYYLEDNWSVTPRLVLNAGLRLEAFDNKNSDGDSYIKMDDMLAPRFGFSFDVKGDSRSKIFGNLGRYFLPVANVINIKQAGGFLDRRTYYVFEGLEDFEYNGADLSAPDSRRSVRRGRRLAGRRHRRRPARRSRRGHGPGLPG